MKPEESTQAIRDKAPKYGEAKAQRVYLEEFRKSKKAMLMRYAAKVDSNQDAIVATLRAAGAYVWIIGLPVDLLVGYKSHTFLVEIKRTAKSRFTPLQRNFFENWCGGTLARIDSPDGALKMIGVLK